MNKNDISRARTPQDIDARWNFGKNSNEIKQAQQDISRQSEDIKSNTSGLSELTQTTGQNTQAINTLNTTTGTLTTELETLSGKVQQNTNARHTHQNKTTLDEITSTKWNDLNTKKHTHENKSTLDLIEGTVIFNLEQIKNENMTNLVGMCISKNKRIVLNISADIEVPADTETILFNLPITATELYFMNETVKLDTDGTITITSSEDLTHINLNLVFDY